MASELFEEIAGVLDLQNKAIMSGIELGRGESTKRIKKLEAANAHLLEAAKGVLSIVRNSYHSDDRGPGDKCTMLEQAIKEAEESTWTR